MKATANLPRLLSALQVAFATRSSAILEVLQNGRRAGATLLDITLTMEDGQEVLTVRDNGIGISDFTNLFHIAESGWDTEVQEEESPFGLGFLAAVLSSDSVTILSNNKRLDLDCPSFRATLNIPDTVEEVTPESWATIITLRGKEGFSGISYQVDACGMVKSRPNCVHIETLLQGFPVAVTFNSRKVFRPAAVNGDLADRFEDCDAGQIYLSGVNNFQVYLQGVQVDHSFWPWRNNFGSIYGPSPYLPSEVVGQRQPTFSFLSSIIHLDPRKFKGVMPERRVLHDKDAAYASVAEAISLHLRKKMLEAKEAMREFPDLFVAVFWTLAGMTRNLDIMNDVPYLPYAIMEPAEMLLDKPEFQNHVSNYRFPSLHLPHDGDWTTAVIIDAYRTHLSNGGETWAVPLEDIRSGKVKMVSRPGYYCPDSAYNCACTAMEAVATHINALVIRSDLPGLTEENTAEGYSLLSGMVVPSVMEDPFKGYRVLNNRVEPSPFGAGYLGECPFETILDVANVGSHALVPYVDGYLNCVFVVCDKVRVPSPWGGCTIEDLPVDVGNVFGIPDQEEACRLVLVPAKATCYGIPGSLNSYTSDGDVDDRELGNAQDRISTKIALARQQLGLQEETDVVEDLLRRSIRESNLLGDILDLLKGRTFSMTFSESGQDVTVTKI